MPGTTDYAQRTIDIARGSVAEGGPPFGSVIVKDGEILAEGINCVARTHDPTDHAEIRAIREACRKLGTQYLTGCSVYAIAHPCPMCLAALYHCAPDEVVFLATREDTAPYLAGHKDKYFEPSTFYAEFAEPWNQRRLPMRYQPRADAVEVYKVFRDCQR
ncbi:nucleoside deaminase [Nocardia spumae]|uniref:nucleoside deaminase n=1 Tax=Nocardia spumae TaxID=2887190 RepID=UPI001D14F00D|nr:nucleoside deaminase [Nocardia spumae]